MIQYKNMDITSVQRGIIAHVVNCQHTMGSGVAYALKMKWPPVERQYLNRPKGRQMLGKADLVTLHEDLHVVNIYGQEFFGNDPNVKYGDLEAITSGLLSVYRYGELFDLPIFLPKLGSKRAGLSWEDEVFPVIERLNTAFNYITTTICVYEE